MSGHETVKAAADVASVGTMLGALVGWLPSIAALFTIIWTGLRIYEWIESRIKGKSPTKSPD